MPLSNRRIQEHAEHIFSIYAGEAISNAMIDQFTGYTNLDRSDYTAIRRRWYGLKARAEEAANPVDESQLEELRQEDRDQAKEDLQNSPGSRYEEGLLSEEHQALTKEIIASYLKES